MAEKNFAITPSVSISRSKFERPFHHKTSFNLGEIVPLMVDEVLPGDTRSIDLASLVRMSNPVAPIMDDIELEIFCFFVPNRIVWSNWKNFMGEAASAGYDSVTPVAPYVTLTAGSNEPDAQTIGDFMGLPPLTAGHTLKVSALPLRGYVAIYNRWFRDQNVEAPRVLSLADGSDTTTATHYDDQPLIAYKKSDYFTRALPYAQKGQPVTLSLGTMAVVKTSSDNLMSSNTIPAKWDPNMMTIDVPAKMVLGFTVSESPSSGSVKSGPVDITASSSSQERSVIGGPTNLYADLTTATAATINQIREAFQLQKLLEKDALYGTRYWEILYGHFGVRSPDATLQDPEYLGGHRIMINVDQVLQTTGSDVSTPSQNSLGTPGANSVTGSKASLFTKSFVEHGFLHIYGVARQVKHTYGQGLNRMWSRFDRYDYYWPEFANLGAQEIKKKELFADTSSTVQEQVFGYQEAWAEYRYHPGRVSGILNPARTGSLDYWTLADKYNSMPSLGTAFLKETRSNLTRSLVTGSNGPDFIADFYFLDTAVRAMPLYSIPGLVDHH